MATSDTTVEPWLRGTRQGTPAVLRAVLHALDLTREDFARWVWSLSPAALEERPYGLPSVGFQARHIARSLDRLLTYAEGNPLTPAQRDLLGNEHEPSSFDAVYKEFEAAIALTEERILSLPVDQVDAPRHVGSARLPVTLGALLVHLADHTQRHSGQAVTTAKLLRSLSGAEQS